MNLRTVAAVVASAALLAACGPSTGDVVTSSATIPACSTVRAGRPAPAGVVQLGCVEGDVLLGVSTFGCPDGRTLYVVGRVGWWVDRGRVHAGAGPASFDDLRRFCV